MRDKSDFYVGYLTMPPRLARVLRWSVPGALMCVLAAAWGLSRAQKDPGDGVWKLDAAESVVGRIETTPYPLIRVLSTQPHRPVETILLVDQGKRGARERAAPYEGRLVRAGGTFLERDGRRLLELAEGEALAAADSLSAPDAARLAAPQAASLGRVVLAGEIIDPKCYSGAMKPGEGKAHKECATLCIAGGIPPMFVTIDAGGRRTYYLLCDPNGRALDHRILPFVADLVEITGELERRDDMLVVKIDPSGIHRL